MQIIIHCQFITDLQTAIAAGKELKSVVSSLIAKESGNFLTSMMIPSRYAQIAGSLNLEEIKDRLNEYLQFVADDAVAQPYTATSSLSVEMCKELKIALLSRGEVPAQCVIPSK